MTEHEQRSLAQILADLQELKRENAQLRADVTALQARQSARPAPAEQSLHAGHAPGRQEEASRPSRRGILRAAVGVAAAAAGAGALVEAGTGTALADNYGTFSTTTTSAPAVAVSALGSGTYGVQAVTDAGYAVYGYTTAATGYAIYGVNSYGGFAIAAEGSNGGGGLSAVTDYAIGVSGRATTTGIGVYAFSSGGEALFAEGGSSYGAYVTNGSSLATVTGTNSGSGVGVLGQGVYGLLGKGSSVGVVGTSSHGIGGYFQGLEAALHLVPTALAGAPTSGAHSKGDLILDSGAVLYVCTASGTPGTWQKVGSQ